MISLINLSFEKLLSPCATETGRVRRIRKAITTFGSEEIQLSIINFKAASGLVSGLIPLSHGKENRRDNERNSIERSALQISEQSSCFKAFSRAVQFDNSCVSSNCLIEGIS